LSGEALWIPFKPGHEKVGGRRKGTANKSILARQQAIAESMQTLGLAPESIDAIAPLSVMRLVMVARLKPGDHIGALLAAEAAAPYVHPKLTSSDVRVRNEDAGMTDEQLKAEIAELERRIKAAETLN
jgi:hypothetical protein